MVGLCIPSGFDFILSVCHLKTLYYALSCDINWDLVHDEMVGPR